MKELISRDSGTVGLITYLRTDSTRISEEADADGKKLILQSNYGRQIMWRQDQSAEKVPAEDPGCP